MSRDKLIPDLGPLEFQLLQILWAHPGSTARDVLDLYNREAERALKYTTVMTLLTRMADKGVLDVDRSRQPFQFAPAVTRESMIGQRVEEFVDLFFGGRAVDLALRLVEDQSLSTESIQRLEALLRRQRRGRERPEGRGA